MRIRRFLKTIPSEATIFAAIALCFLLLKVLLLNQLSEAFPYAHEIGMVLEALLLAVVSGYVFYVAVNHTKDVRERRVVAPFIAKQTQVVIRECKSQLAAFGTETSSTLRLEDLRKDDLLQAFSKIAPYSDAPLVLGHLGNHANWFQFFEHHNDRTTKAIRRLLDHLVYVPVEIVNLISSIEDCNHFNHLRLLHGIPVRNTDLSVWAEPFYEYCVLCQQLDGQLAAYESRFAP